jgi:hypothetical protein
MVATRAAGALSAVPRIESEYRVQYTKSPRGHTLQTSPTPAMVATCWLLLSSALGALASPGYVQLDLRRQTSPAHVLLPRQSGPLGEDPLSLAINGSVSHLFAPYPPPSRDPDGAVPARSTGSTSRSAPRRRSSPSSSTRAAAIFGSPRRMRLPASVNRAAAQAAPLTRKSRPPST